MAHRPDETVALDAAVSPSAPASGARTGSSSRVHGPGAPTGDSATADFATVGCNDTDEPRDTPDRHGVDRGELGSAGLDALMAALYGEPTREPEPTGSDNIIVAFPLSATTERWAYRDGGIDDVVVGRGVDRLLALVFGSADLGDELRDQLMWAEQAGAAAPPQGRGGTVLVVEDEDRPARGTPPA